MTEWQKQTGFKPPVLFSRYDVKRYAEFPKVFN